MFDFRNVGERSSECVDDEYCFVLVAITVDGGGGFRRRNLSIFIGFFNVGLAKWREWCRKCNWMQNLHVFNHRRLFWAFAVLA